MAHRASSAFAVALVIAIFPSLLSGQQRQPAAAAASSLDAAFSIVRDAVTNENVPGAIALVVQHGKIIREEAFGLCDVEDQRPMTPTTLCWIASITKPVTVAAAMKLAERGK